MEKETKQKVILRTLNAIVLLGLGIVVFSVIAVIPTFFEMWADILPSPSDEIPTITYLGDIRLMIAIYNWSRFHPWLLIPLLVIIALAYLRLFKILGPQKKIIISEVLLIIIGLILGIFIATLYCARM